MKRCSSSCQSTSEEVRAARWSAGWLPGIEPCALLHCMACCIRSIPLLLLSLHRVAGRLPAAARLLAVRAGALGVLALLLVAGRRVHYLAHARVDGRLAVLRRRRPVCGASLRPREDRAAGRRQRSMLMYQTARACLASMTLASRRSGSVTRSLACCQRG